MAITTQNPNLTPQQPNAAQPNYDYQWYQTQTNITSINTNLNTLQTQLTTLATFGSNIQSVGTANTAGNDTVACADNHTHIGVTSIKFNATQSGVLTFAGSSVSQATTTFTFTCDGAPVVQSLPYVYVAGQTFLVLTPTGAGQTFTLPAASSVPSGFSIRVHTGAAPSGNNFSVVPAGSDTFNSNGGTTFQINPLASTVYIGARFTSDGVSKWFTEGYN